jgi:hypothetical protein
MILKIRNEKGEWISIDAIKGEPGADGYTPIKGVDYFDGVDGKDGYTPIKGIDYFDGAPGKDGKDGTLTFEELTPEQKETLKGADGAPGKDGVDGYTPIKGVDYFDGKDGKDGVNGIDGKDGVDGKDYILTDADKQEIAAMVDVPEVDVDLTDYYTKEEIDALLADLPTGEVLPNAEGVEF